ncbi:hypothetical protein ULMS_02780 [Patiriisocius marinistellae]|uniref:HTH araC/xylS-type domain-containing protein n=1 Tax=Patiriisocius marinistellae TaxID=2494560 RepID=A0A5J4FT87_9FLAO|nr:hypothetical protein ULMS_02780 [Patiriisocius marinistellae]
MTAQNDTLAKKSFKEIIGIIQTNVKDTTVALNVTRYYSNRANKEANLKHQWGALQSKVIIYNIAEDFPKAAVAARKLIAFSERNMLEQYYMDTYMLAGIVVMREGAVKEALVYFEKTKAIAYEKGNEDVKKQAQFFINNIKSIGSDKSDVIAYYQNELKQLNEIEVNTENDSVVRQRFLMAKLGLSDAFLKNKVADSANFYINDILKNYLEKQKDSCMVKPLYMMLGETEILLNNFDAAAKSLDYSKNYCKPHTRFDSLLLGKAYGALYYKQKKYEKAITSFEQALEAYEISDKEEAYMDDLYKSLAIAYKETNNLDKASFYFEKYGNTMSEFAKVQDTIDTEFRKQELAAFEAEIEQLRIEKEDSKSNLNYLLLGGSIVILALLFLLLKFYKTKKANEVKFEALLAKINAAEAPKDIIDTKDEVLEEKNTLDIPVETQQLILDGLAKLEEKEYFLSQECNSHNMAKKIGTNTSYLSKVINAHFGKNFNTYINDLRINYAIVRLKNDVFFRAYSIQSIAEEIGYKSADSFTKYFKKDTGLNPSFYIKNIKNVA